MILIAHRGHFAGARTSPENTPSAIEAVMHHLPGVSVEIDVWYISDHWYLGHDQPEHAVSPDLLNLYFSRLWMHAKNAAALYQCVQRGWRCFAHDQDRYVLTSNRHIWTFPDRETELTSDSILVMPEWITEDVREYAHQKIWGVCTDLVYDLLCQSESITAPRVWRETLDRRLTDIVPVDYSPHDVSELEHGRCLALYHPLQASDFHRDFFELLADIAHNFPEDLLYGFPNGSAEAHVHWTLLQTKTFKNCEIKGISDKEISESVKVLHPIVSRMPSFSILWCGIAAVNTGLILLGLPTFTDLNQVRDKIRGAVPNFSEPYRNNMVHASILRFRKPIPCPEWEHKLQEITSKFSRRLFGRTHVDHIMFRPCTWTMNTETLKDKAHIIELSDQVTFDPKSFIL